MAMNKKRKIKKKRSKKKKGEIDKQLVLTSNL